MAPAAKTSCPRRRVGSHPHHCSSKQRHALMLTKRIIACLDVRAGRVVKGIQFLDIIDAGAPAELAHRHAAAGADEIVLLDITATHEGRGTLLDTGRGAAAERFW